MASFDDFIDAIRNGADELARTTFQGLIDEARRDTEAFLETTRQDLKRWTRLLAAGELTEQDFSDLVQAKKALARIHALRQTGVSLTHVERFRNNLISLVVDTAFDMFT